MLIRFEPLDFMCKSRWESFLEKLNIPYTVWPNIISVALDTKDVCVSEQIGADINTVTFNPNEAFPGC